MSFEDFLRVVILYYQNHALGPCGHPVWKWVPRIFAFYGLTAQFTRVHGMLSLNREHYANLRYFRRVLFRGAPYLLAVGGALMLNGCAGGNLGGNGDTRSGLVCVDDSSTCINRRQMALKDLTSRSDRSWIQERASARTYAAGVRMFALKTKKNELTCGELKLGQAEAKRAPNVLKSGSSSGLTPAQISRGKMLASEISRDLGREIKRRCR